MYLHQLQTMHKTFEEICQGQDPWVALGNFMNDWVQYHPNQRPELVVDALASATTSDEMHRWAVFCAASTEWFCTTYHILCPAWVYAPQYILKDPWFTRENASVRQWLLDTTPEEFTRRNIFCGNRLFLNKYERA